MVRKGLRFIGYIRRSSKPASWRRLEQHAAASGREQPQAVHGKQACGARETVSDRWALLGALLGADRPRFDAHLLFDRRGAQSLYGVRLAARRLGLA